MTIQLDLQIACDSDTAQLPTAAQLQRWVEITLVPNRDYAELTLRIVDEAEGTELNETWRHKSGPTNVLSFPFEYPPGIDDSSDDLALLGDIVICAPVVAREAVAQNKSLEAHWAHLVIHGTLHLLGYDHLDSAEAEQMESLEIDFLQQLGYPNPYQ